MDKDKKFVIAMSIYAVLAVFCYFVLTEDAVLGASRVPLRWMVLAFLGLLAFKTWVARKAGW